MGEEMMIDPGIGKILSIEFVRSELVRHPKIRAVGLNEFLYLLKKCWAAYDPEKEEVFFDSSLDPSHLARVLNNRHGGLSIKPEEAWTFIFFHEAGHSLFGQDESRAEGYAEKKFVEWRNEARAKIIKTIKEGIAEGFKARIL